MSPTLAHTPVLPEEVLQFLNPRKSSLTGQRIVDATLGAGGHTRLLLEEGADVIGIDRDAGILAQTREALASYGERFHALHGNFGEIGALLAEFGCGRVNGILADVGVSSMQLDEAGRGFSFMNDGPLDMRMDASVSLTAAEVVNTYPEARLVQVFSEYGEERLSKTIARSIVEARKKRRFDSTKQLADLVYGIYLSKLGKRPFRIHPATCVFQAIRIEVNDELGNLRHFMGQLPDLLVSGGRVVVISFHSLEDRIVKQFLNTHKDDFAILTKKPVEASPAEMQKNPRSRSAKLRAAERL